METFGKFQYKATTYFKNIDVRIGNVSTSSSTNVAYTNTRCEYKTNDPQDFEYVTFSCPAPGIVGNTITLQKHSNEYLRAIEIEAFDCPNTFVPLNNRCFKIMPVGTWDNLLSSCVFSRGSFLTWVQDPVNEKIAKKLMALFNVEKVFTGLQLNSEKNWVPGWYKDVEVDFNLAEQRVLAQIKNQVVVAKLDDGEFKYWSGHTNNAGTASAICQYNGGLKYTNWGLTEGQLEPRDEAKKCIKTCYDSDNPDCHGEWRVADCATPLNYICYVGCELIHQKNTEFNFGF